MKRQRKKLERQRDGSQANSKTIETLSFCTYVYHIVYYKPFIESTDQRKFASAATVCEVCLCVCLACDICSIIRRNAGAIHVI